MQYAECAEYVEFAEDENYAKYAEFAEYAGYAEYAVNQNVMKSKVQCPHSISRTCLAQEFGLVFFLAKHLCCYSYHHEQKVKLVTIGL